MPDFQEDLQKVIKKANDTYALLAGLSMGHEILKSNFKDLTDEISKKVSIDAHKESCAKAGISFEEIKKEIRVLIEHKDSAVGKIKYFESEVRGLKDMITKLVNDVYDTNKRIDNVPKLISVAKEEINSRAISNLSSVKEDIGKRIDMLPIPKDAVNMDQVKAQISSQIEPSSLDSRNALLTAKNHELRLSIAEKKVDGLMLQLRNLELRNEPGR